MKISEAFADPRRKVFSFELFPPKTDAGQAALERTIRDMAELQPAYVSVTYGAGGSTRAKTVALVEWIQREARLCAMAHLTCVGATEAELGAVLDDLVEAGIENVMALRGDPPAGQTKFERTAGGFGYAADLIALHPQAVRAAHLPGRRRLPRGAPRMPRHRPGHPPPEGQGRRGAGLRRHAALLRQPLLLRLRRAGAGGRHWRPDRTRADADSQRGGDRAHDQAVGRDLAGGAAGGAGTLPQRRGGHAVAGDRADHRAGRRAAARRRARDPLLHAEPVPRDAHDPDRAQVARLASRRIRRLSARGRCAAGRRWRSVVRRGSRAARSSTGILARDGSAGRAAQRPARGSRCPRR